MRLLKYLVIILVLIILIPLGFLYMAPEKATGLIHMTGRLMAGVERREIRLPDGLRYVYLEGGTGEPLMLLHGFGADKENFTLIARHLTPRYRVIIPDHVGFGESSHPADADYRTGAQARRLHALAQALGIGELHLGGSSMGGHIAMAYASLYPKEVKSLWLLDPGGVWSAPESEFRKIVRETGKNPLMAKNEQEFAETFRFVMNDPPPIPRPMLDVMSRERIRNFPLEQRIFKELTGDPIEKRIAGSSVPTLIVFGEKDRAIHPATAEVLHRLMPNSRVIMLPGIGHLPMLEAPARCANDYLKFRGSL
ncbi:MAG TPA: alpha/beta hydrolase [Spirochaetota bacterium]|nr:alpha/beta hydrolase [Spirochaetota bacterium]